MALRLPRARALVAAVTTLTLAAGTALLAGVAPAAGVPADAVRSSEQMSRTGWLRLAAVRLDSGVVAARAHVERGRVKRTEASARSREAAGDLEVGVESHETPDEAGTGPTSGQASGPAAPDPRDDARAYAEHVLRGLPGGDEVEIAWDHPMIGSHLGGVRLDDPTVMMLNSRRFEAEPERIASTVMHEIGHFYQGAAIASRANAAGGWWAAYWELDAALTPVFGGKWMERSADCVALHLGATWTHYTSDCSDPGAVAAVEALVARSMP